MGKRKERGKKPPRKEMRYRVFPDVNRIGRPKAVTYIPILLGHYRQLQGMGILMKIFFSPSTLKVLMPPPPEENCGKFAW